MINSNLINQLMTRRDTWQGRDQPGQAQAVSTGHPPLDALLQGGWPAAALTELLPRQLGIGELSLLLPTLRQAAAHRQLVWLNPPYRPHAPALHQGGIPLRQVLVVQTRTLREWLWAAEQSLRGGALLLAWPQQALRYAELRKLQLAAAEGGNPAFLFRPSEALAAPSPAALRLQLAGDGRQLLLTVAKLHGQPKGCRVALPIPARLQAQPALANLPAVPVFPEKVMLRELLESEAIESWQQA